MQPVPTNISAQDYDEMNVVFSVSYDNFTSVTEVMRYQQNCGQEWMTDGNGEIKSTDCQVLFICQEVDSWPLNTDLDVFMQWNSPDLMTVYLQILFIETLHRS